MTTTPTPNKPRVTRKCECCDPGCPAHQGKSECTHNATTTVRRIDMEDGNTRFRMCDACANDALDSGVFA